MLLIFTSALKVGCKKPILVNVVRKDFFELADHVCLLAALETLYNPLEVRETKIAPRSNLTNLIKVEKLGYWQPDFESAKAARLIEIVKAVDIGRIVCKDIGAADPERMSASNIHKYVESMFISARNIKVNKIQISNFI